jgi:hypothetical protein
VLTVFHTVYVAEHHKVQHLFSTDPQELWEVREEISRFNATLLNGGQILVTELLQEEVAARLDLNLDAASAAIKRDHQDLARALNGPTFAVDECHRPLQRAVGQLFHSDYQQRTEADVLRWQQYELFRSKDTPCPDGYDYAAPTTLFSAFRWVLEGYLKQPDTHQTTVFASTYFSVWEPLLDESTYSRQKPAINRIVLSERLSLHDLVTVLKDKHPAEQVECKEVQSVLEKWQGRPGFFFDHFLRCFNAKLDKGCPLSQRIQVADKKAWLSLCSQFDPALKKLKAYTFTGHTTGVTIPGLEVSLFLSFCARIRGANIYCASAELAHLVSAGFVFVKDYQPGPGGKSIGVIDEPLVKAYLLKAAELPDAHACCDKFIARLIDTASGTGYGNAAEYALANQILTFNKRPLVELLREWGLKTSVPFLFNMVVRAAVSTSINDIPDLDPIRFLSQLQGGRLVLPRDGIVMPDACFFATTSSSSKDKAAGLCLVTVQCKTVKDKLNANEFNGAIRSTSTLCSTSPTHCLFLT